ncbi:hypothetical protein [Rhodococcus sp. AG1013]|uniref:hypothetical protein n=1 Tax=unclassified Rhodococcus (in: high G+C Gram-positive bacteria) TaxID=192944 RepID=UPI000E2CF505|nr:hypothetical protein [Rhodococcus sp. AG1013]RDI23179.1 hypothetical protein DEU38_11243 [Rhodococcus sp. AG1013]
MMGERRWGASLLPAAVAIGALLGCTVNDEQPTAADRFTPAEGGRALHLPDVGAAEDSWLELGVSWTGRVSLPQNGFTACHHYTDPLAGGESWGYEVTTSDFTDYDGGGESPGQDFSIQASLNILFGDGDERTNAVSIAFSGPDGEHYRLGGTTGEGLRVAAGEDHTALTFTINGLATSIDRDPVWTAAAGSIRCDSIEEIANGRTS